MLAQKNSIERSNCSEDRYRGGRQDAWLRWGLPIIKIASLLQFRHQQRTLETRYQVTKMLKQIHKLGQLQPIEAQSKLWTIQWPKNSIPTPECGVTCCSCSFTAAKHSFTLLAVREFGVMEIWSHMGMTQPQVCSGHTLAYENMALRCSPSVLLYEYRYFWSAANHIGNRGVSGRGTDSWNPGRYFHFWAPGTPNLRWHQRLILCRVRCEESVLDSAYCYSLSAETSSLFNVDER